MAVTLKQIAELAGVHKSTVDKVIHNRPGVSDAKRQEIRQLLDEYGYEANPLAKALNYQKKKMAVAVVMPDVDAMPYIREGIEIVRPDMNSFNIEIIYHIVPASDAQAEAECLRSLVGENIAGVLLVPIVSEAVQQSLTELAASSVPVVMVHSDLSDAPRFCFVGQDMIRAGKVAARMMQLLLPCGGEIAVISSRHMSAVAQREESFTSYLNGTVSSVKTDRSSATAPISTVQVSTPGNNICTPKNRICISETVLIQETSEDAYRETSTLLARRPELKALYITCGCVASICKAVTDAGLSGQLHIVCYEEYPEILELVKDGIVSCTIGSNLEGQGRIGMRMLFEYLVYGKTPANTRILTANDIKLKENI